MPDSVRTAIRFLEKLYAGNVSEASAVFTPKLRAAVSDDELARTLKRFDEQFGKPVRHSGTRTAKTVNGEAEVIYLYWDFEKQRVDARMLMTPQNQIVSLSFETPVIR